MSHSWESFPRPSWVTSGEASGPGVLGLRVIFFSGGGGAGSVQGRLIFFCSYLTNVGLFFQPLGSDFVGWKIPVVVVRVWASVGSDDTAWTLLSAPNHRAFDNSVFV